MQVELADLCRGAADPEPILHSFQDKELMRIGVRDILDKDSIRGTTAALSDVAETILKQIALMQEPAMAKRFGYPTLAEGPAWDRRADISCSALASWADGSWRIIATWTWCSFTKAMAGPCRRRERADSTATN